MMKADSFGAILSMFDDYFAIRPLLNLDGVPPKSDEISSPSQLQRDAHESGEVCSSRQPAVAAASSSINRNLKGGASRKKPPK